MQYLAKIQKDFKEAFKQKRETEVSVLRMLQSAIKNAEVAKKRQELTDEEVMKIIKQQIKQHQDSIEQFEEGNREDLVRKEEKELQILQNYLPEQMGEQEIREFVKKIIAETELTDFGPIMGKIMAEIKDKADGNLVKKIVEEELKHEGLN
ncbi:MAG: glutamyl-tRNA amidotransferase [Candidatus Portnoybacteria bacterium CG23_combo_of_CG06-09_8_20_14_all_37_13]|uniref:Glutamyl-tRNA amidotransferase n=1 Tax=Candidatus Portnoybacteria bacterium CG23_combo_of_CG06-09_8_20_14_all_37_13 TaxID=1974819 RepID=A0A2G9YE04_9BACT|nr:MAG: glutamyl-tRNA amidotransferase [Candidatus Portnoybacteria bacterium CG23_combo_of_CG06-09_8_20_14_all_37_13]